MRTVKFILVFFLFLFCSGISFANDLTDKLVEQAIFKYAQLDKFNKANAAKGKSHLNEYVIELDPAWKLDPNWIEEKGNGQIILSEKYKSLSKMLKDFNDVRKDDLRFYVVVINDYQLEISETVDLNGIKEVVDNITHLVSFPDAEKDFKRFLEEASGVPKSIANSLQVAGYENRIVYFYGVIRLFKLNQNPRFYKHDNLSIIGKGIELVESEIRDISRKIQAKGDNGGEQVESAVASIINAVRVVVDMGDESKPPVDCSNSVQDLLTLTKPTKDKLLQSSISSVAKLLDTPSPSNLKGSPYVIIDQPADFASDDVFTSSVLPDKVSLLAQDNSKFKLYVIFKEINFVLPASEWKIFAEKVAEKSSVAKQANTIVMVIPYFKLDCLAKVWFFSVFEKTGLLMPAVYCTDDGLRASMNAALAGAGKTWEVNFNQAFSHIPKRYTVYDYKILWNGDLVDDGVETYENVTDYPDLREVRIIVDERFYKIRQADSELVGCGTSSRGQGGAPGGAVMGYPESEDCRETFNKTLSAILASRPDFRVVKKTNLVQSKITKDVAKEFTFWYAKRKNWGIISYFSTPEDEIFYGGRNPEKIQDALTLIDIASGVASVVGADAIFDGFGAYYAYDNGEYLLATAYGAAATIPFLSSGVRRAVVEGGEYVLKTAKGTYVRIPRNVLGMNYLLQVKDAFSHFMKVSLNVKTFSRAAKYKTETNFIYALEDGLIADNSAIRTFNEAPELIDEFHAFHKAGRGGLAEFLVKNIDDLFELNQLKNLEGQTPTGKYLTNIAKAIIDSKGLKIPKPARGRMRALVDDIMQNGDRLGNKTEEIIDIMMDAKGFQKVDAKYHGVNGFDGCYIPKGQNIENATEIMITESKQFKQGVLEEFDEIAGTNYDVTSGLKLNPPIDNTGLPTQMANAWVRHVIDKIKLTNPTLGGKLEILWVTNKNKFSKYVNAVDKSNGEIFWVKLDINNF